MVLVLQLYDVYRGSILGFARAKVLAVEQIALAPPIIVSTEFSVLPGFAPAAELVAWRVPKGATFVVEQKDPKPLTSHLALLERTDASLRRADKLAALKQGPPADESVPPLGQTAGVGLWETNKSVPHMKERETIYSV
jgi:hypothetical protein